MNRGFPGLVTDIFVIFQHFSSLLKKANEWLRLNPNLKVKTCESVEVKGELRF